ncbi:hypothetical protein [Streptomyces fuscichromogenes]|uniref:Uncharacterized protein n=1 Tax=Streptomyces fuscichromogenes TaxID=1324013 RepID=A0A918CV99_9ACTN|nr:hypothetical protein [Streptomyces fuscichromogenes]GGN32787.1 hypothetical protein GCM10011578_071850 [Streptomyces fuscichromogenes]
MTGTSAAGRRGRHRKPRPRKPLFAAGGLALAAGVLGLVRLTPDGGGVSAPGTAEAEPHLDPTADATARPANAAATVGTLLRATPSAATVPDGAGTTTAPATTAPAGAAARTAAVSPSVSPTALPGAGGTVPTTIPTAPTRPTGAPPPAADPAPAPTPTPTADQPGDGVCLPVVGLCVSPPAATAPRPGG